MRVLFAVALLAGLLYVAVTPPDRVPDENAHFLRAVAMAEGDFFPPIGFRLPGHHFPAGIRMFLHTLGNRDPAAKFTLDEMRAVHAVPLLREQRAGIEFPALYSPLPYAIPAGVAFIGLQAGARPFWIFYLGRVANLLVCLTIAWAALRAIPNRAAVGAAVLLLPMTLYQLASWSADAITISVALLLTCLLVRNLEAEDVAATRELAAIGVVAFLLGLCKPGYFLLLVPLFFVPTHRFGTGRRRAATVVLVTAAMLLGTLLAVASARAGRFNVRQDLPVDPAQQMRCVTDDPVRFAGVFVRDLGSNGRFYLEQAVGRLGLMNVKLPGSLVVAEWLLLLWTGFTCGVRWKSAARVASLAACAAILAGISITLYFLWSIICGDTIEGVQGRYYLPVLPLLLFALSLKARERGASLVTVAIAGLIANGIAVAVLLDFFWR
ncbi:MAG TPA: DUF2142 domain-containing protein [Thermoanaerobaculia bacterium]|jgi:uncharacterized membrane protein